MQAILVLALTYSCNAQGLPGSQGPRVEKVASPPNGLELLWVAVVPDLRRRCLAEPDLASELPLQADARANRPAVENSLHPNAGNEPEMIRHADAPLEPHDGIGAV
jgi:hypothetical protein